MKKDVFFLAIGIVLFFSGIFSLSVGLVIRHGQNFFFDDTLTSLGVILIVLGVISFVVSGIYLFSKDKKTKE